MADENWSVDDEHKALYVLQHWEEMPGCGYKLVPEHVEIRSLYNPENPGLVQVSCVSLSNVDFSLARTFGVAGPQLLGWSPVVPLSLYCGTSPMPCPFLGGQLELCACPALLWKEDCSPCVFFVQIHPRSSSGAPGPLLIDVVVTMLVARSSS